MYVSSANSVIRYEARGRPSRFSHSLCCSYRTPALCVCSLSGGESATQHIFTHGLSKFFFYGVGVISIGLRRGGWHNKRLRHIRHVNHALLRIIYYLTQIRNSHCSRFMQLDRFRITCGLSCLNLRHPSQGKGVLTRRGSRCKNYSFFCGNISLSGGPSYFFLTRWAGTLKLAALKGDTLHSGGFCETNNKPLLFGVLRSNLTNCLK